MKEKNKKTKIRSDSYGDEFEYLFNFISLELLVECQSSLL